MRPSLSRLPDSLIGQVPMFQNVIPEPDQDPLHFAVKMPAMKCILGGGVDDFPINVHLKLVTRRVADANRSRVPVTGTRTECALVGRVITINRVQNQQFRLGYTRSMQDPVQEPPGLLPVAQLQQRPDRQRRVAQPAKSVIPIQIGAETLWQGGGRRGDDGSGGRKAHQLECEGAPNNLIPVSAVVVRLSCPPLPPLSSTFNPLQHGFIVEWREDGRTLFLIAERKSDCIACPQIDSRICSAVMQLKRNRAAQPVDPPVP